MLEAKIKEPVQGIFQITVPYKPITDVNVFAIPDEKGMAIVDTGPGQLEYVEVLDNAFANVITGGVNRIHTIYLTHPHTDHVGQSNQLVERTGASVYLHPDCVAFFRRRYKDGYNEEYMSWMMSHGLPNALYQPMLSTMALFPILPETRPYEGQTIHLRNQEWQILDTPGHSPGHLSFYQPEDRILLAGDVVLERETPLIDIQPIRAFETVHDYLHSLDLIREMNVAHVLPGHGDVFRNLKERVDHLTAHHHRRMDQVQCACRGDWRTAFQIAQSIWPTERPFMIRLTMCQTIGYLGYLDIEARAASCQENGVTFWKLTDR